MEHDEEIGIQPKPTARAFRAMLPTQREVLLARLLLHLIDVSGREEDCDADLLYAVKRIAEETLR